MSEEIWKDIKGYNGQYQVSNLGNVFARETFMIAKGGRCKKIPHILKHIRHSHGYRYVTIQVDYKRKNHYVHRLVAEAFIQNPENKLEVNHINGIKDDNRVENLEWCTLSENRDHAARTGLMRRGKDNHSSIPIIDTETGENFATYKDAAKANNINYGTFKDGMRKGLRPYKRFIKVNPAPTGDKQSREKGLKESRFS